MDDVDITAERDEREMPARLAASRRDPGPKANGSCHWCGEPVAPQQHYCDCDCREDHERRLRALRRA
ncbi:hypothetical protein [Comamonas antarctica]|uniref:hypothetical protein n=1 Tax=Comamonas antarctica TaxID=2743470 RepID=UPI0028F00450|nr:hypothetical protein [Comamonas antarctica]